MIKTVIKFVLCALFSYFVPISWICWFSSKYWDVHDFYIHTGGDGIPFHFHTCRCWNCNKEFTI
jgi:hypothetical protein